MYSKWSVRHIQIGLGIASYFSYPYQLSVLLFPLNIHEKKTTLNARKV